MGVSKNLQGLRMSGCALVAIARDEGRYILEWLAFHLAIGIQKIVVYDNESVDGTGDLVDALSRDFPVSVVRWPSAGKSSPQRNAYNDALRHLNDFEWVAFVDIDEFIVPWGYADIDDFLTTVPADASSVALNWRLFGSSGRTDPNYASVLRTFEKAASLRNNYQRFFKSVSRVKDIADAHIHDVELLRGRLVYSNFTTLETDRRGAGTHPEFAGIQVNHYQCKTFEEFKKRMSRGNPNYPLNERNSSRLKDFEKRFVLLDQNVTSDFTKAKFMSRSDSILERMQKIVGTKAPIPQSI